MYKLIGAFFVVCSSTLFFTKKVRESYFTYRTFARISDLVQKIIYERNTNLPYHEIFEKYSFATEDLCMERINKSEYKNIESFFSNLGKHSRKTESEYLQNNLEQFNRKKEMYHGKYIEKIKIQTLYGISLGLFIVIFFI